MRSVKCTNTWYCWRSNCIASRPFLKPWIDIPATREHRPRRSPNGKTTYRYDSNDRLTQQSNPDGSFLAYAYDANGNITQRSTPAGTIAYTYTPTGQLASVTDKGQTTRTSYDNAGRPDTLTLPNGSTTQYAYDLNGRLQQIVHRKGSSLIAATRYTVADNGQRTKVEEFDSQSTVTGTNITALSNFVFVMLLFLVQWL